MRLDRAESEGVPPFVVLTNREAKAIAKLRPRTVTELSAIHGIGPAKLRRHGQEPLALVTQSDVSQSNVSIEEAPR